MKKLILIIIAFFLLFATLLAQQTENAFIVVIDGARYSETFGDETHQYIPKIWNQLRPMGAIYNSFYIDGWTLTNSGHASIITGTWQKIANDGSERPHKPTLFEYFRKQHNTSITENYVVLGKDKLKILTHSNHSEYGSNYRASVKTSVSQYNDIKTWENIKEVITAHHPRLMIVNLAETDASGHSGVWNSYVSALQQADSLVSELWTLIQSDSIYSNKTTLFVTNDHGRHSGSFSSHGDSCEGCQHIMLLVIGPDTPAGVTDEATWKQIDIVPTVGYLLNFDTPYCTGTTISTAIATNVSMVDLNLPRTINLLQNYPNPFNSSTTIDYFIEQSGNVQLSIFDVLGRSVRTLTDDNQSAGYHKVIWDGKDENGEFISSGTYFYTLKILGSTSISKRMLMLK